MLAWKPKFRDPRVASVRYRCLIPLEALRARGLPVALYEERDRSRYTGVVFSKLYGPDDQALARDLRAAGGAVILDLCDNHFYNPFDVPAYRSARTNLLRMIALADLVVCSTAALAEVVRHEAGLEQLPEVVGDPVECATADVQDTAVASKRGLAQFVWFGIHGVPNAPCGMLDLLNIDELLTETAQRWAFEVIVVSNDRSKYEAHIRPRPWPSKYVEWDHSSFPRLLARATAVLLPITRNPFTLCKSNNRLATALLAGVPVIADSIPSYEEFAPFAYLDDWRRGLETVLSAPAEARARAMAGRRYVSERWSVPAIADQWVRVLEPFLTSAAKQSCR